MEKSLKLGRLLATAVVVVSIVAAISFTTKSTFAQNVTSGNKSSTASNATSANATSMPKGTTSSSPSSGPGY